MSNAVNQLGANVLTCHFWAGGKCPGGNMSYTHVDPILKVDGDSKSKVFGGPNLF